MKLCNLKLMKLLLFKLYFINIFLYAQVFEGYTVFTPMSINEQGSITVLINNDLEVIHNWLHVQGAASMPYLMQDSSIIYPYKVESPTMTAGGVGGGIQRISWDGDIRWEFILSDNNYQHHHDIEPLPNGNVLLIAWERKTAEQAYALGRISINNPLNEMWSTAILEYDPLIDEIVWEWHLWDHLIQQVDSLLPNYGIINQHPELFDINCGDVGINAGGPQAPNADWMHINSIDYNSELDQIVISSRSQNEIFIIDHSTNIEEASGHSGGNSGKGGDILFRWGNPVNYGRGDVFDQKLNSQHSVNWIAEGIIGGGNLILFNNFHGDTASAILELITPFDSLGNYFINNNEPYGPDTWTWIYSGDFTTPMQGGVMRLPNGNSLITQTHMARIIEINLDGDIVWDITYETEITNYWIARAQKYPLNYFQSPIHGDINNDSDVNILDLIYAVNYCLDFDIVFQFDLNEDSYSDILDIVYLKLVLLE